MNGSTNSPPPTTSSDKLSGQLIIKAQLGDDIRKMMIHNEDLTLNGKYLHFIFQHKTLILFRTCSDDGTYICRKDF
jgi:hypothetical protein